MARYNNLEQSEKNKAEALSLLQIVVKTGEITDIQLVHDIFEQLGRHTRLGYFIGCGSSLQDWLYNGNKERTPQKEKNNSLNKSGSGGLIYLSYRKQIISFGQAALNLCRQEHGKAIITDSFNGNLF